MVKPTKQDQESSHVRKAKLPKKRSLKRWSSPNCDHKTPRSHIIVCAEMVYYCFEAIIDHLSLQSRRNSEWSAHFTNEPYPLFVTWRKGNEKRLRGCIGTFNATALYRGLRDYAKSSAFEDSRFAPIKRDEVQRLHCTVSLLTDFEKAKSLTDWDIGVHGINIEFCMNDTRKVTYHATYLPEVAREQNWNHMQAIDSLVRKSGYTGAINETIYKRIGITKYRSQKITKNYAEYRDASHQIITDKKTIDDPIVH